MANVWVRLRTDEGELLVNSVVIIGKVEWRGESRSKICSDDRLSLKFVVLSGELCVRFATKSDFM